MIDKFRSSFSNDDIGFTIFQNWLQSQQEYLTEIDAHATAQLSDRFWLHKALRYFFPSEFLLSSPFLVPGMREAVLFLREAYENRLLKKIVIYGDRDADGVCSASLLYLFLRDTVGYPEQNLSVLVPLEEDKYGIVDSAVERILAQQPNLLFTLDCGSMNKESLDHIQETTACNVVVLDHHFIPEDTAMYPPGAFVNPKRLQFPESARDYCTASLVWQFTRAFTYSFTPEMDNLHRVIASDTAYDFVNGVQVKYDEAAVAGRVYDFTGKAPSGAIDAQERWQHLIQKSQSIYKFNKFISELPLDLQTHFNAGDKYQILKHFGMQKVSARVKQYMPLAGLGLVADLMPLWDDNRILLAEGLRLMNNPMAEIPLGVRELLRRLDVSAVSLSEQDIGFSVCPVINAAGRLGKSEEALLTLIEKDPLKAAERAFKLKKLNDERKELTKAAVEIIKTADLLPRENEPLAIIYHPEIHRGISGLIASRVAEECGKPAIVLVEDGPENLRGSIRAPRNENVFALISALGHYFVQFGGHRQAAGFTLPRAKLEQFKIEAKTLAAGLFSEETTVSEETNGAVIEVNDLELRSRLWDQFLRFAPYGVMNPHPTLKIALSSRVKFASMGKTMEHARLDFTGVPERSVEGVWFFHKTELSQLEHNCTAVWAEPHVNRFAGKLRYQLRVKKVDIA